jgi:hypothetical protein
MVKTLLNLGVLLAPAASFAVVITFDDISTTNGSATWQGNRYLSQNVLFSTDGSQLGAFRYSNVASEINMVGGSDGPTLGEFNKSIEARFVSASNPSQKMATSSVSFWVRDAGFGASSNDWDARFFDASGNELARREGTGGNVLVSFTSTSANIHHIEFKPSGNNEGIDTLTFAPPAAVPEPGTIAALVLGVGALAARRRRNNK